MFPADISGLFTHLQSFMLVFLRMGAFMMAAPIFGSPMVTVRVRLLLASLIALMLLPIVGDMTVPDLVSGAGFLIVLQQLLIGLAMGFLLQLTFAAVVLAGQVVAMTMGLGFAMSLDPQNGVQVPVVSQFYLIVATLIFLAQDLHLYLLEFLAGSFQVSPPSGVNLLSLLSMETVYWASQAFAAALSIAIPILAGLLIINICFGVMTRAAPQLNIFAVGFPVTIMAGFLLILMSLPGAVQTLVEFHLAALDKVGSVIGTLGG